MADTEALFGLLRQTADPAMVDALKTSVETAPDRFLNRINPLTYAAARGLDEEGTIGSFETFAAEKLQKRRARTLAPQFPPFDPANELSGHPCGSRNSARIQHISRSPRFG